MFQEVLFSYRIRFRAMATCEWQLSQQRLCWGENKEYKSLLVFPLSWIKVNKMSPRALIYHPVLILLWSIVYRRVPGIGAISVDFANVKDPVPTFKEKHQLYCCAGLMSGNRFCSDYFSVTICSLKDQWESHQPQQSKYFHLLTLLVFQKPCCLPAKKKNKLLIII